MLVVALWVLCAVSPARAGTWEPADNQVVDLYNASVDASQAGDPSKAEKRIRKALKLQPGCGIARLALASYILNQDRPDDAVAMLVPLATDHPDQIDVWTTLARAAFGAQRFELSADAADTALALDPASVAAVLAARLANVRLGNYDRVMEVIAAARQREPKPEWDCIEVLVLEARGRHDDAVAMRPRCPPGSSSVSDEVQLVFAEDDSDAEALARTHGMDGFATLNAANKHMAKGRYREAVALLDHRLQEVPEDLRASMARGQAYYMQENYRLARQDLERVYKGDTWVHVGKMGSMSGILTKRQELQLAQVMQQSVVILVLLDIIDENVKRAHADLDRGRRLLGSDVAVFHAAEARVRQVDGKAPWGPLKRASTGPESDQWLIRTIGQEMVRAEPMNTPPWVFEWLGTTKSYVPLYNKAIDESNRGAFQDCLTTAEHGLALFPEVPFGQIGYGCAVGTGDLTHADVWDDRVGKAGARASDQVNHMRLLHRAGQHDRAIELAGAVASDDADIRRLHHLLLQRSLTEVGRLDDALAMADGTDPGADMSVAHALSKADRHQEALRLALTTCPRIEADTDLRENCAELTAYLRQFTDGL